MRGGVNGIGRLTTMTDPTGSTSWAYDANGHVIKKVQKQGTLTFTTPALATSPRSVRRLIASSSSPSSSPRATT